MEAGVARLGSVQPIRQARTAIQRESPVARADLNMGNGWRIVRSVYLWGGQGNEFGGWGMWRRGGECRTLLASRGGGMG